MECFCMNACIFCERGSGRNIIPKNGSTLIEINSGRWKVGN